MPSRGLLLLALLPLPALAGGVPTRLAPSDTGKSSQKQAEKSPPHFSLSAGIGAAYVITGVELGFRLPYVEPFAAAGVGTFFGGVMGGARIFLKPNDIGAFVNLEGGLLLNIGDRDIPVESAFGVTAGYRFGFSSSGFLQAGGGAMVLTTRYEGEAPETRVRPDVDFAIGVAF